MTLALVDDMLAISGGRLPWKSLCSAVASRAPQQMTVEEVLVCLPAEYLSSRDRFVRLPPRDAQSLSTWVGWAVAADDILDRVDGCLPWQTLQAAAVARYRALAGNALLDDAILGDCFMVSVPTSYLSKVDGIVRKVRPPAAAGADARWARKRGLVETASQLGERPWVGRRVEITGSTAAHVASPSCGWITDQVSPTSVVVVFDSSWSVEQFELPPRWQGVAPEAADREPNGQWRLLPDSATYALPARFQQNTFTEGDDERLLQWGPRVTDMYHHWHWIACTMGRLQVFSTSSKRVRLQVFYRFRTLRYQSKYSSTPERMRGNVKRHMVIEALLALGGPSPVSGIYPRLKALYPGACCDTRVAPAMKTVMIWQKNVQHCLVNNPRLFTRHGSVGRRSILWYPSDEAQKALGTGNLELYLKHNPARARATKMSGLKKSLNKVRAFGALAGR